MSGRCGRIAVIIEGEIFSHRSNTDGTRMQAGCTGGLIWEKVMGLIGLIL